MKNIKVKNWMIREDFDKKNNKKFMSAFNMKTGATIRTGLLKDDEKAPLKTIDAMLNYLIGNLEYDNPYDIGVDAFVGEFPELIDIGVMGSCPNGLTGKCPVQCYQNGHHHKADHMSVEDFRSIIEQSSGKVFQVALGGRGDVNKHPQLEEIFKICKKHNIIPNYTTSGFNLTDKEIELTKKYCGTVAVSWYRHQHTIDAIERFLNIGMTTNIHYVLSNASIDEAIERLENKDFPNVHAVTFLLHKPVGLGDEVNVLKADDPRLKKFFELVDRGDYHFKIGFDSCSIPGVINYTKNVVEETFDTCEGARFSCYITPDMKMLPCSFDNEDLRWAVDLREYTMEEAWNSLQFEHFRKSLSDSCGSCSKRDLCMGGCPIRPQVVLCNNEEKNLLYA